MRQQRTRTAHPIHPLVAIAKGQWGCVWNEIRSKYAVSFRSSTQRRMRSGHVHFGRTATWKGTQDWCERQDRFGLDLQINREGVAVQTSKGGKARVREGIPNSLVICARKLCRDIFNPFAGNLVLRPGECRLSHVGQQINCIPSVEAPFPAMGPFHNTVSLIIAFPFW